MTDQQGPRLHTGPGEETVRKSGAMSRAPVQLIKEKRGVQTPPTVIPSDDEASFALINSGNADDLLGVRGGWPRDPLKRCAVKSIDDLAVLLALCQAGHPEVLEEYIRRKTGLALIAYEDPLLVPILRETCGLIVYEEQFDRILFDLAGDPTGAFGYDSLDEAGRAREELKGKRLAEAEEQMERFRDGCIMMGTLTRSEAMLFFETLMEAVDHCTSKARANAEALQVYQRAYLKAHIAEA